MEQGSLREGLSAMVSMLEVCHVGHFCPTFFLLLHYQHTTEADEVCT